MLIAASGGFGRPYQPALPGLDTFTGLALHAGTYRHPEPFAGQRVVVVGAGNSAVQIAVELADSAHVTLASRKPVKYAPQRPLGRDIHFWSAVTGIDRAPIGPWVRHPPTSPVSDTGRYRQAVTAGSPDRRPMFTSIAGNEVIWSGGSHEAVDAIILATGYRPGMDYLYGLGALDDTGRPRQRRGLSTTLEGLGFVGLDWQRSFASATLRGVGGDARYVVRRLSGSPAGRLRERIRV
jgi:putative flavoprotein involved in K+ transport